MKWSALWLKQTVKAEHELTILESDVTIIIMCMIGVKLWVSCHV